MAVGLQSPLQPLPPSPIGGGVAGVCPGMSPPLFSPHLSISLYCPSPLKFVLSAHSTCLAFWTVVRCRVVFVCRFPIRPWLEFELRLGQF